MVLDKIILSIHGKKTRITNILIEMEYLTYKPSGREKEIEFKILPKKAIFLKVKEEKKGA